MKKLRIMLIHLTVIISVMSSAYGRNRYHAGSFEEDSDQEESYEDQRWSGVNNAEVSEGTRWYYQNVLNPTASQNPYGHNVYYPDALYNQQEDQVAQQKHNLNYPFPALEPATHQYRDLSSDFLQNFVDLTTEDRYKYDDVTIPDDSYVEFAGPSGSYHASTYDEAGSSYHHGAHDQAGSSIQTEDPFDSQECFLDINKLPRDHALILDAETHELLHPKYGDGGIIRVAKNDMITIDCVNENSKLQTYAGVGDDESRHRKKTLKCLYGKFFDDQEEFVREEFECSTIPKATVNHPPDSNFCVGQGYTHFQVGFLLENNENNEFKSVYDGCTIGDRTLFVKYKINNTLIHQEIFKDERERLYFENEADPSRKAILELYEREQQKTSQQIQLADNRSGRNYYDKLTQKGKYFLEPHRLAGDSDFMYRAEQLSASLPVNIQPMWSNLKQNWSNVREAIRNLALRRTNPLTIYSGTFGNHMRTTVGGVLYLGEINGIPFQKIPNIFWTTVHDEVSKDCITLVGGNNPIKFVENLCDGENQSEKTIQWLERYVTFPTSLDEGFVYWCSCKTFVPAFVAHLVTPVRNILM